MNDDATCLLIKDDQAAPAHITFLSCPEENDFLNEIIWLQTTNITYL